MQVKKFKIHNVQIQWKAEWIDPSLEKLFLHNNSDVSKSFDTFVSSTYDLDVEAISSDDVDGWDSSSSHFPPWASFSDCVCCCIRFSLCRSFFHHILSLATVTFGLSCLTWPLFSSAAKNFNFSSEGVLHEWNHFLICGISCWGWNVNLESLGIPKFSPRISESKREHSKSYENQLLVAYNSCPFSRIQLSIINKEGIHDRTYNRRYNQIRMN